MNNRRKDGRETWNRLLEWDKGQGPLEKLAGALLKSENYTEIDSSIKNRGLIRTELD